MAEYLVVFPKNVSSVQEKPSWWQLHRFWFIKVDKCGRVGEGLTKENFGEDQ